MEDQERESERERDKGRYMEVVGGSREGKKDGKGRKTNASRATSWILIIIIIPHPSAF